jgi:hypothetical protein
MSNANFTLYADRALAKQHSYQQSSTKQRYIAHALLYGGAATVAVPFIRFVDTPTARNGFWLGLGLSAAYILMNKSDAYYHRAAVQSYKATAFDQLAFDIKHGEVTHPSGRLVDAEYWKAQHALLKGLDWMSEEQPPKLE